MKLTTKDFPEENQRFLVDDFELNILLHHLEFKQTDKILEIGCNDTELSNTLYSKGCEVWGVDVLFNNPKFKFIRGNFQDVELPKNYFDIVIDVSAIHHFGLGKYTDRVDPDADIISAKKIHTILKDNGLFYISTDQIDKTFKQNMYNYYRQYNIEEFNNRIIKPSNFKIVELKFYKNNTYPLTEINPLVNDYSKSQMFVLLMKDDKI